MCIGAIGLSCAPLEGPRCLWFVLTNSSVRGLISVKLVILFIHYGNLQATPLAGELKVGLSKKKKREKGMGVRAMVTPNRQSHIVALPNGNTERHGIWFVLSLNERVNLAGATSSKNQRPCLCRLRTCQRHGSHC